MMDGRGQARAEPEPTGSPLLGPNTNEIDHRTTGRRKWIPRRGPLCSNHRLRNRAWHRRSARGTSNITMIMSMICKPIAGHWCLTPSTLLLQIIMTEKHGYHSWVAAAACGRCYPDCSLQMQTRGDMEKWGNGLLQTANQLSSGSGHDSSVFYHQNETFSASKMQAGEQGSWT
jgi:hypothetical protein